MPFQPSTCPYCSSGCGLFMETREGRLVGTHPSQDHPVSRGSLCMRGWNCAEAPDHADRLLHPMVRKRDLLAPVSYEAAVKEVAHRLGAINPAPGVQDTPSILFAVGPSIANEDAFAVRRLARLIGATICSSDLSGAGTAQAALRRVLGRNTAPGALDALGEADQIWVFGADLENFPQIASRVTRAARRGAELVFFDVVAAPPGSGSRSEVLVPPAEAASLPLVFQKAALGLDRIPPRVKAAPGFESLAAWWHPERASSLRERLWLSEGSAKELARTLAEAASPAVIIGERWLSAEGNPEQTVQLLQALALLGAEERLLIAAGECNSWGVLDQIQEASPVPSPLVELLDPAGTRTVSALFIFGDDLLRRANHSGALAKKLAAIETVVVADRFAGETQRFAHAVLPTCCFGELDGTLRSAFGTVQRWRQGVKPPGECCPESTWVTRIGRRLGFEEWPATRRQWFEALQKENPLYAESHCDRLYYEEGVPGISLGEVTRLSLSAPSEAAPLSSRPDFPMRLSFAAHPAAWSTGALSQREELLRRECPESTLAANPQDLKAAGLKPGWPAKVATPAGEAVLAAQEEARIPPGVILIVPVPGSAAATLRALTANQDRSALGTHPVPARLEKV